MHKLVLLRHGESTWNRENRFTGWTDVDLSSAGIEEARPGSGAWSGEIRLTLHGGRATVTGRRSEASLYDFALATYDEGDMFDQSLAKGFVDLWGLPSRLAAARDARLAE